MTHRGASAAPPPPPPPPSPPPPPPWFAGARPAVRYVPPAPEAVRRLPLGIRALLRQSLDLLTRRDAGLRGASFYIGFMVLATVAPMIVLVGLAMTSSALGGGSNGTRPSNDAEAWYGWLVLAGIPAFLGYVAAGVEARTLATAVIGGAVEGRPLRLRESISLARQRFWHVLGAGVLVGILTGVVSWCIQFPVAIAVGFASEVTFGLSLLVSLLVTVPFVYVPAGVVLGQVPMLDAITRSWRLVRLRVRLAVVVAVFSVIGQFVVLFGLSIGLDMVFRLMVGTGVLESFPPPLVVPLAAALVFALGTLLFLVEAIAAAPAVHAFAALTHYTHGLQAGRDRPATGTSLASPWMTPGLAIAAMVAFLAMLAAVLTMPA